MGSGGQPAARRGPPPPVLRGRSIEEEASLSRGRHRNSRRFSALRGRGVSSHRPRTRVRPALAGHRVPSCGTGAGAGERARLRDGARRVLGRAPPHLAVRPVRGARAGRPRGGPGPPGCRPPVSPAGHRVAGSAPGRDGPGGGDAGAPCREGPDRGGVVRGAPPPGRRRGPGVLPAPRARLLRSLGRRPTRAAGWSPSGAVLPGADRPRDRVRCRRYPLRLRNVAGDSVERRRAAFGGGVATGKVRDCAAVPAGGRTVPESPGNRRSRAARMGIRARNPVPERAGDSGGSTDGWDAVCTGGRAGDAGIKTRLPDREGGCRPAAGGASRPPVRSVSQRIGGAARRMGAGTASAGRERPPGVAVG